ncbi:MAG TPA: hypothetical protein VK932_01970 [Kofleriaceae bacterium]|nr:hypothetical protein [Kofleriaceae bacterium]
MRRLALLVLALALATSCKKDSSSGLPPASDWSAPPAGSQGAAPAAPGNPSANPHANPHGPGMGGGNPHAGVDMGGAGGNPHAGVDMSGGGAAAGPMAQKTTPRTLEKLPDGRFALGPFSVAVPAGWTEKAITSSMRTAQFALPGPAGEAELVVYYFGEGGAGGVQANLDRWLDQFQQPSGKASKDVAKVEKTKLGGQEATLVSVSGRYVTTTMPGGGDPVDKADQALIGAIVESPRGPYYFKLVGPKATVDAHAPKVRAMLTSLKLR